VAWPDASINQKDDVEMSYAYTGVQEAQLNETRVLKTRRSDISIRETERERERERKRERERELLLYINIAQITIKPYVH
jgi:hypothetical protein